MNFAPYTLSYATYVSATIHARVAAQSPPGSEAHASLRRCVSTLKEHQELSLGPKKALEVIRNLMRGVGIDENDDRIELPATMATEDSATISDTCDMYGGDSTRCYTDSSVNMSHICTPNDKTINSSEPFEYDMDCIFQSFNMTHEGIIPAHNSPSQDDVDGVWEDSMQDTFPVSFPLDPLFGLENIASV